MSVEIEIRRKNGGVQRRELPPGRYLVGREAGHIILGDPGVSIRHAQLTVTKTAITLTDLGSTNGTFDGTVRLTAPTRMVVGRMLRLGGCTLTLVEPEGQTPTVPAVSQAPAPRRALLSRAVLAVVAALGVAGLSWSVWYAAGAAGSSQQRAD